MHCDDDFGPLPQERVEKIAENPGRNAEIAVRLAREILALRKDKSRLDWLVNVSDRKVYLSDYHGWTDLTREAIDAAMEGTR